MSEVPRYAMDPFFYIIITDPTAAHVISKSRTPESPDEESRAFISINPFKAACVHSLSRRNAAHALELRKLGMWVKV